MLQQQIIDFCTARGKTPTFGIYGMATVVMEDLAYGFGPYIAYWNSEELGAPPTVADGFSEYEVHAINRYTQ